MLSHRLRDRIHTLPDAKRGKTNTSALSTSYSSCAWFLSGICDVDMASSKTHNHSQHALQQIPIQLTMCNVLAVHDMMPFRIRTRPQLPNGNSVEAGQRKRDVTMSRCQSKFVATSAMQVIAKVTSAPRLSEHPTIVRGTAAPRCPVLLRAADSCLPHPLSAGQKLIQPSQYQAAPRNCATVCFDRRLVYRGTCISFDFRIVVGWLGKQPTRHSHASSEIDI
jgi:hypothetical protein